MSVHVGDAPLTGKTKTAHVCASDSGQVGEKQTLMRVGDGGLVDAGIIAPIKIAPEPQE